MINATAHLKRGKYICVVIDQSIGNGIYRLGGAMETHAAAEVAP